MRRRLAPGEAVALALVAEALVLDVILLRRGDEPISTCVRASRIGRVVAAALAAHLCFHLPHDPLTAISRRVTRGDQCRRPKS